MRRSITKQKIVGDASETALLRFVQQLKSIDQIRNKYHKIFEIPFNSKNKWQLSIHTDSKKQRKILVMKGAPEVILDKCSTYLKDGVPKPIDDEFKNEYLKAYRSVHLINNSRSKVLSVRFFHILDAVFMTLCASPQTSRVSTTVLAFELSISISIIYFEFSLSNSILISFYFDFMYFDFFRCVSQINLIFEI
jgi:hypothetical protein